MFGVAIAYFAVANVVYPRWIEPMVTINQRIAEKRKDLEKLRAEEKEVDQAQKELKDYAMRVGTYQPGKLENALREKLNQLIARHKLEGAVVTPNRAVEDSKTGLSRMLVTVTATGTLQAAVDFLKDVAELPYLVRVSNPALYPAGSGRKDTARDRLNLRMPIEVLVLPETTVLGRIAKIGRAHV